MTNNVEGAEERLQAIVAAGERSGDRVHPLPMYDEYAKLLESDVADLKNIGGREAGSITAAKFLEHFVDYPWIHIDMAGPAFLKEPKPTARKAARASACGSWSNFCATLPPPGVSRAERSSRTE